MKRWLIPLCVIIVLVLTALIPVRQTYQLNINSSYFNVYQNLSTAQNWVRWYPSFKDYERNITGNNANGFKIKNAIAEITLQKTGLGFFNINISRGNGVGSYDCIVFTDDKISTTNVVIRRRISLFKYLWSTLSNDKKESFIYSLKSYLEDTRRYYGFVIKTRVDHDKILIVKRLTSFNDSLCQNNRQVLKQLHAFTAGAKLDIKGPVQLQYTSSTNDSTEVMIGLPVNKKQVSATMYQFMETPRGKIVVGYFKGKYKQRQKLYDAMMLYLGDHYLHAQTKPFEKFVDNRLPINDESIVDLQLVIPYI